MCTINKIANKTINKNINYLLRNIFRQKIRVLISLHLRNNQVERIFELAPQNGD
jgi:hypothetical protein